MFRVGWSVFPVLCMSLTKCCSLPACQYFPAEYCCITTFRSLFSLSFAEWLYWKLCKSLQKLFKTFWYLMMLATARAGITYSPIDSSVGTNNRPPCCMLGDWLGGSTRDHRHNKHPSLLFTSSPAVTRKFQELHLVCRSGLSFTYNFLINFLNKLTLNLQAKRHGRRLT